MLSLQKKLTKPYSTETVRKSERECEGEREIQRGEGEGRVREREREAEAERGRAGTEGLSVRLNNGG